MLTPEEINKLVKERFPYTQREITCWTHAQRMQDKRDKYRKQLEEQHNDPKAA